MRGHFKNLKIVLSETSTILLFEAPLHYYLDDNKVEGDEASQSQEEKQIVSVKSVGSQTKAIFLSNYWTSRPQPESSSQADFVSTWKLYDENNSQVSTNNEIAAVQTMQRILNSNTMPPLTLRAQAMHTDPFSFNVSLTYSIEPLEELKNGFVAGYSIYAVERNPIMPHILAAAYYIADQSKIIIWNLKNTNSCERFYSMDGRICSMAFSTTSPNMLALGFSNADVRVLDISCTELKILHSLSGVRRVMVRNIQWWCQEAGSDDLVYTAGTEIFRLRRPFLRADPEEIMNTSHLTAEGTRLGVVDGWPDAPFTSGPDISCLLRINSDLYLFGAVDGYIRLCSVRSLRKRLQKANAHLGVVNAIKACPHCSKIFLTCGTDGTVKIWAVGIIEPLIVLYIESEVENIIDIAWDPKRPTTIAGITPKDIHFWDIARKGQEPASSTPFYAPTKIEFSSEGDFIIVSSGSEIHLLGLKGMPHPVTCRYEACHTAILQHLFERRCHILIGQIQAHGIFEEN